MPEIPFALQWKISEDDLTPLKNSNNNGGLYSTLDSSIPGFHHSLCICPNGHSRKYRGLTFILLRIKLENVKKVDAKCNILIESANCSSSFKHIYISNISCGISVCSTKDFFDPEKKYIVDGKCTVKVNGIFKFVTENSLMTEILQRQKWDGGELGDELWKKENTKDFRITVDGKVIRVHKTVLDARSNVFSAMPNLKKKKSIEGKVEIPNFSFDVVETAIKMIYNCNFASSLTFEDTISLLQFFDKYNLPSLKDKVEHLLINRISASTVCRLSNCSVFTNSEKLKLKCMEFLMDSFASRTPLADFQTLDKDIAFKILENSLYKKVETK